jgi:hypothetical protein
VESLGVWRYDGDSWGGDDWGAGVGDEMKGERKEVCGIVLRVRWE